MAETQVTQKLSSNPLTMPALFRADGTVTGGQNGFVTMLQALDVTMTAAAQPQPAAPEPAAGRPAPRQQAENGKADDDHTPEPAASESHAADDHPQPHHDSASAAKSAKGQEHECRQPEEKAKAPETAPEPKEAAQAEPAAEPDIVTEAAAPVEDNAKPRREEKPAAPTVNLLAGLPVTAPKTVATQKASPEPQSCAAETAGAAPTQPIAAPDAKTAIAAPTPDAGQNQSQPEAGKEKPSLTLKLTAEAKPAAATAGEDQPQANDNNPLRPISPATTDPTLTEQRHAAESDATVSTAKNAVPAAPPSVTPGFVPATTAAAPKTGETAPQLQARLETNSVRGMEGNVRLQNAYSNTAQLTAARSAQTATLRAPEIVEQVAVKLNHQAKAGLDTLTLQLRPADLGRIDVKLNFHEGSVTGTIIADNQTTLDLLAKDQRTLERALQDSGLRTDSGSLSFQLRDQSGQQTAQQERGGKRGGWQDVNFDLGADTAVVADGGADSVISADRVNLRV